MLYVTLDQLLDGDACNEAQVVFKTLFGTKAEVTRENIERFSQAYPFWHGWARDNLITAAQKQIYTVEASAAQHGNDYYNCPACALEKAMIVEFLLENANAARTSAVVPPASQA